MPLSVTPTDKTPTFHILTIFALLSHKFAVTLYCRIWSNNVLLAYYSVLCLILVSSSVLAPRDLPYANKNLMRPNARSYEYLVKISAF